MPQRRLCRRAATVLVGTALAACGSGVDGTAIEGISGSATDWAARPGLDALATIPATASTRQDVVYVDVQTMNSLALRDTFPAAPPSGEALKPDPSAWLKLLAVQDVCASVISEASNPYRTGVPTTSLSLRLSGPDNASGLLALCDGGDPVPGFATNDTIRTGPLTPQTIAGLAGASSASGWWMAERDQRIVLANTDVLGPEVDAAISGTTLPSGSLADDAGVRTVLGAAPDAAMVEFGTALLGRNRLSAPAVVREAFEAAIKEGQFAAPPVPNFGGFAWTPEQGASGQATFVTIYDSPENAATITRLLRLVWDRVDEWKYSSATTVQQGTAVITVVHDVPPTGFGTSGQRAAEYPGFLGRQ